MGGGCNDSCKMYRRKISEFLSGEGFLRVAKRLIDQRKT